MLDSPLSPPREPTRRLPTGARLSDLSQPANRLLRPGFNCWARRHADRAAVLVDAQAYFLAFAEAATRARESIVIVGWDFNSQINLHHPPSEAAGCDELGPFLNALAARRRG